MSLYEILDVWGFSYSGWTPIMLRLSGLVEDDLSYNKADYNEFTIKDDERDEPIYEFMYLNGGVKKGELKGTWNWPPRSSTNTPLLWPDSLSYFIQCIREYTPDIFKK